MLSHQPRYSALIKTGTCSLARICSVSLNPAECLSEPSMDVPIVDWHNKIVGLKPTIVGYIKALVFIIIFKHGDIYIPKLGYHGPYDLQWDINLIIRDQHWIYPQVIKHGQLGSPLFQPAFGSETHPTKRYFSGKPCLITWKYWQQ